MYSNKNFSGIMKILVSIIVLSIFFFVDVAIFGCNTTVKMSDNSIANNSLSLVLTDNIKPVVEVDFYGADISIQDESKIYKTYNLGKLPELVDIKINYPSNISKSGIIYVDAVISETGRVLSVKLAKVSTLGSEYEKAALQAVKCAKFKPGRLVGGRAVISSIVIPIKFTAKKM
jgi:TonB family protein